MSDAVENAPELDITKMAMKFIGSNMASLKTPPGNSLLKLIARQYSIIAQQHAPTELQTIPANTPPSLYIPPIQSLEHPDVHPVIMHNPQFNTYNNTIINIAPVQPQLVHQPLPIRPDEFRQTAEPLSTLKCQYCFFTCDYEAELAAHYKRYHSLQNNMHICYQCNAPYPFSSTLKSHMKKEHGVNQNTLVSASLLAIPKDTVGNTVIAGSSQATQYAPINDPGEIPADSNKSPKKRKRDDAIHHQLLTMPSQTPSRIEVEGTVAQTQRVEPSPLSNQCDFCFFTSDNSEKLKKHATSYHNFKEKIHICCAPSCGKIFKYLGPLKKHQEHTHNYKSAPSVINQNDLTTDNGETLTPSDLPPKKRKREAVLQNQLLDISADNLPIVVEDQQIPFHDSNNNISLSTQETEKALVAPGNINEITPLVHTIAKRRTYQCRATCREIFSTRRERNIHERNVHGSFIGAPSFLCTYCTMTFDSSDEKQDHEQINHNKNLKNICPICLVHFTRLNKLKRHLENQHNIRDDSIPSPNITSNPTFRLFFDKAPNIAQPSAQKNSDNPSSLISVTEHNGPPFTCSLCDRTFQRKSDKTNHENKTHRKKAIVAQQVTQHQQDTPTQNYPIDLTNDGMEIDNTASMPTTNRPSFSINAITVSDTPAHTQTDIAHNQIVYTQSLQEMFEYEYPLPSHNPMNSTGEYLCRDGCDRSFKTTRGRNIHETMAHREKTQVSQHATQPQED